MPVAKMCATGFVSQLPGSRCLLPPRPSVRAHAHATWHAARCTWQRRLEPSGPHGAPRSPPGVTTRLAAALEPRHGAPPGARGPQDAWGAISSRLRARGWPAELFETHPYDWRCGTWGRLTGRGPMRSSCGCRGKVGKWGAPACHSLPLFGVHAPGGGNVGNVGEWRG